MSEGEGDINPDVSGAQDKDAIYAARFWKGQPPGKREVMVDIIRNAAGKDGFIGVFIDPWAKDFAEIEKEKMSAYRLLAKAQGYQVGQFVRHPQEGIATASITKVNPTLQAK